MSAHLPKDNLHAPQPLLHLDCLHCAINQVINTTEVAGTPEPLRRELMHRALVLLAEGDVNRNNCIQIEQVYRMVAEGLGDPDPYRETRLFFDRALYRLLPQLRCPTALICREQLLSPAVPVEAHDMRCTMLITERGVLASQA